MPMPSTVFASCGSRSFCSARIAAEIIGAIADSSTAIVEDGVRHAELQGRRATITSGASASFQPSASSHRRDLARAETAGETATRPRTARAARASRRAVEDRIDGLRPAAEQRRRRCRRAARRTAETSAPCARHPSRSRSCPSKARRRSFRRSPARESSRADRRPARASRPRCPRSASIIGKPMKAVLPSPQTSVSAPMRARDQCSARPSDANNAHAPRNTSHIDAPRNQNCQSNCSCRNEMQDERGQRDVDHPPVQRLCGNVAGGLAMRATSTPRTRQATSNSKADIGASLAMAHVESQSGLRPCVSSAAGRACR